MMCDLCRYNLLHLPLKCGNYQPICGSYYSLTKMKFGFPEIKFMYRNQYNDPVA